VGTESGERRELLHLRLTRCAGGGVSGSLGRPGEPQQPFNGWLGLLALLEHTVPLDRTDDL